MSGPWPTTGAWVCHSAAGGGLLLLLVWLLMRRTRQPARQQRLGECGLLAALLVAVLSLGPAWLPIPVPIEEARSVPPPHRAEPAPPPPGEPVQPAPVGSDPIAPEAAPTWGPEERTTPAESQPSAPPPSAPFAAPESERAAPVATPAPDSAPSPGPAAAPSFRLTLSQVLSGLGLVYALAASLLAGRWLLGHLALWRLLGSSEPAPASVAGLFAAMTPGRRPPRLLVSRRLRVPVSCGIIRPTVLVPASFCTDLGVLRWVFAHELTHLERHDPWTCLLFGLGQVVYFYLPWFWWVRRRVGLCQEYVADAVVAHAEEAPEEYAQFLLNLSRADAVPAGAAGLAGRPSDLCRRITVLLQTRQSFERRCPRLWSWVAASVLAALAVLAAGLRLQATPNPRPVAAPTPEAETLREQPPALLPAEPRTEGPPASAHLTPEKDPSKNDDPVIDNQPPRPAGFAFGLEEGRLGVRVGYLDPVLIDQLDLPRGQGLTLLGILPDSPAARAGLRAHDLLLALAGRPVPSDPWRLAFLLDALPGETPLAAVLVRHGKRQTIGGLNLPGPRRPEPFRPRNFNGPGGFPGLPPGTGRRPGWPGTVRRSAPGRFTARLEEGPLVIEVTGARADGGRHTGEIIVRSSGRLSRYSRVDQGPLYRDRVERLLAGNAGTGIRLEVQGT
jgi:beta-lactamase regulating signal transducer with metallopeptidase domain